MGLAAPIPIQTPWPAIVAGGDFGGAFADELGGQINLDYAATTPSLRVAVEAVLHALPAYGSVHRGGGARSRLTTEAYEAARTSIARFVDCDAEHVVVFVRNTTEAINLVASSLPRPSRILCSPLEHHANLLPWRDHHVEHLPFVSSAAELVESVGIALDTAAQAARPFDVLAVCGASNVTGEVMPVTELAAAAHKTGTQILVDAAQLAPHRRVSVRDLDADYLALSGHKLYAPFGSGVLVMRRNLLQDTPPLLKGGGAVRLVTLDNVVWADLPHRFEAGTPNVLGAIALAAACDQLATHGLDTLEHHEHALATQLWQGLSELPACTVLRGWPDHDDRVAVASFIVTDHDPRDLAETLAQTYGIAVRSGLFCAHPFVSHLLNNQTPGQPGASVDLARGAALRASVGIGVQADHIQQLLNALTEVTSPAR